MCFPRFCFWFWLLFLFVCLRCEERLCIGGNDWSNRKGTVVDAGERGADCCCDVLEQGAEWDQGTSDRLASGRCTGSSPRVMAGRTRCMGSWVGVGWPLWKSSFDASIRSTEEDLGVWEGDNLQNSHQNEGRVNSQDRRQDPWAAPGPLDVPDQGLKAGRARAGLFFSIVLSCVEARVLLENWVQGRGRGSRVSSKGGRG